MDTGTRLRVLLVLVLVVVIEYVLAGICGWLQNIRILLEGNQQQHIFSMVLLLLTKEVLERLAPFLFQTLLQCYGNQVK